MYILALWMQPDRQHTRGWSSSTLLLAMDSTDDALSAVKKEKDEQELEMEQEVQASVVVYSMTFCDDR